MKTITIKPADLAGLMVQIEGESTTYYIGESYGDNDGVVYKNEEAFNEHEGVCYIPEHGFFKDDDKVSKEMLEFARLNHYAYIGDAECGYTRDDIYAAMYNHLDSDGWVDRMEQEYGKAFMEGYIDKCIEIVFQEIDWQCPETLMNDWDWEEDWEQYLKDNLDDKRLTDKQRKELGYE